MRSLTYPSPPLHFHHGTSSSDPPYLSQWSPNPALARSTSPTLVDRVARFIFLMSSPHSEYFSKLKDQILWPATQSPLWSRSPANVDKWSNQSTWSPLPSEFYLPLILHLHPLSHVNWTNYGSKYVMDVHISFQHSSNLETTLFNPNPTHPSSLSSRSNHFLKISPYLPLFTPTCWLFMFSS